jgi:hypothetical protein
MITTSKFVYIEGGDKLSQVNHDSAWDIPTIHVLKCLIHVSNRNVQT